MKIYDGPDGSKYVETGEERNPRVGEWFLHSTYECAVKANFDFDDCPRKILRLATPEEVAGTEKKMCPAGCGAEYANHHVQRPYKCPWLLAYSQHFDKDANLARSKMYADARWREFVSKPSGVLLTPESVGKAYRNGFTKVTVEEACESGVYQVRGAYNQLGQAYWVKEDGKLADRCEAWTATFHNVKDKDLDLISEWDEKAEAGGLRVDAATIAGRTITLPVDASGLVPVAFIAPAQPEILPTWADSDVLAEAVKIWGPTDVWRKDDVMHWRKMLVAWLNAPDDAPEDDDEPAKPDAPDRRAEHVPVAKAWVNPAMLGR